MAYESGSASNLNKAPKLPKQFKSLVPQNKPLTSPVLPVNLSKPPEWADWRRSEAGLAISQPPLTSTQIYAMTGVRPKVAAQLGEAGVKFADVSGVVGGTRLATASFDPYTNVVQYGSRAQRGLAGNLEHEIVHAATYTIPNLPASSREDAAKLRTLYQVGGVARAATNGLPAFVNPMAWAVAAKRPDIQSFAEGIADRSGAYPNIPKWGDRTRNYIFGR